MEAADARRSQQGRRRKGRDVAKVRRGEGYSWLWRVGWRLQYILLHVYGPASLDEARDPLHQMRRDRLRRQRLHAERSALGDRDPGS